MTEEIKNRQFCPRCQGKGFESLIRIVRTDGIIPKTLFLVEENEDCRTCYGRGYYQWIEKEKKKRKVVYNARRL